MIWEGLHKDLVVTDLDAVSAEEVFQKLGGKLVETGYCKESYIEALITREKSFPTGINMGEVGIAMPHTDREHVNKSGVAIARLKKPVKFLQMGTLDVEVQARIIFMLAVEDPDAHLETLIVLDGSTGQNALEQARQFSNVTKIDGIILTKLDGTAKGGIAIAIQSELSVPVKYIGVGEHIDDLQKFDPESYVNALFADMDTRSDVEILIPDER